MPRARPAGRTSNAGPSTAGPRTVFAELASASRTIRAVPDDCLFCGSSARATTCARATAFVAIRDIAPQAPTHLLVIPERHVETFRDVGDLDAGRGEGLLEFVADTAREAGLEDYRVLVNVGPGGGQTVFHLHCHVLGGREMGQDP